MFSVSSSDKLDKLEIKTHMHAHRHKVFQSVWFTN